MKTFLKNQWARLRRLEGPVLPLAAFLMSLVVCGVVSLVNPAPSAEIEAEFVGSILYRWGMPSAVLWA